MAFKIDPQAWHQALASAPLKPILVVRHLETKRTPTTAVIGLYHFAIWTPYFRGSAHLATFYLMGQIASSRAAPLLGPSSGCASHADQTHRLPGTIWPPRRPLHLACPKLTGQNQPGHEGSRHPHAPTSSRHLIQCLNMQLVRSLISGSPFFLFSFFFLILPCISSSGCPTRVRSPAPGGHCCQEEAGLARPSATQRSRKDFSGGLHCTQRDREQARGKTLGSFKQTLSSLQPLGC